jgi:hypothetical protein
MTEPIDLLRVEIDRLRADAAQLVVERDEAIAQMWERFGDEQDARRGAEVDLRAERSSRQAWAEEALRWREYTGVPAEDKGVDWIVAFGVEHHDFARVCACISDEQATALGPRFSRPVCAVHEQKDASDA